MIEQVRQFIWEHRHDIPGLSNAHTADISISLFNHGRILPWSKVLFLITHKGKLVCIVKTTYDQTYAARTTRECELQSVVSGAYSSIRAPRVYASGMTTGRFFYAEEVCDLPVLSDPTDRSALGMLYRYQQEQKQGDGISGDLVVRTLHKHLPQHLMDEHRSALQRISATFARAQTHGDLTSRNVLITDTDQLVVIDWERAGERPFWGIDLCHYIARAYELRTRAQFEETLNRLSQQYEWNTDTSLLGDLFVLDTLLDALEKEAYSRYRALVEELTMQL